MSTPAAEYSQDWAWLRYACLTQSDSDSLPLPSGEPSHLLDRVLPLIYTNAHRRGDARSLPTRLATRLQAKAVATVAQHGTYHHWLVDFGERLAEQGLTAILLKSSAFNGWLYPENSPRGAVDIDLWVPPESFDACCALMKATHQALLLDESRRATHDRLFERVFEPLNPNGPTVEIHRGLTNPHLYSIDNAALLAASRAHPAYGNPALRIMNPIHNLLNLALHAARDRDFAGYGLVDANELWSQSEPHPREVLDEAQRWQCTGALYFLLGNAAEHLGTPVAPATLETLKPTAWRRSLTRRTCRLDISDTPAGSRAAQIGANFALTDRIGNALRFQRDYLAMRMADLRQRS